MAIGARLAIVFAAPVLALGVAACGGSSTVSKGEFKDALVKQANIPDAVAQCITDDVFAKLNNDQLQKIKKSTDGKDITAEEKKVITDAAVKCATGAGTTTAK